MRQRSLSTPLPGFELVYCSFLQCLLAKVKAPAFDTGALRSFNIAPFNEGFKGLKGGGGFDAVVSGNFPGAGGD